MDIHMPSEGVTKENIQKPLRLTIFGIVYYIGSKTWVYIDNLLEATWLTSFRTSQKTKRMRDSPWKKRDDRSRLTNVF